MSLLSKSPRRQGYATFGALESAKPVPHPPTATFANASWLSRLTFGYARELFETGNSRQLEMEDLWQMEGEFKSSVAYTTYKRNFLKHGQAVTKAVLVTFGPEFFMCGLGSATMAACAIFAPVVLQHVIDAFSQPTLDTQRLALWVGAFFASRLVNAFMDAHVTFKLEMALLKLTVSLKSLIFEKAMRRSIQSKANDNDSVDVSNLYTADISNLMYAGRQLNAVWIMPIQVPVVIYLLYNVLDVAAFAGLGVIFVSMFLNNWLAKIYMKAYYEVTGHKDNRMRVIKEVFGAIQVIKLNAWENKFMEQIRKWRILEMNAVAKYLYVISVSFWLNSVSSLCVSVASFATYALVLDKELTAAKVFTAMVLFNSIRRPLSQFPEALQAVLMGKVALTRMAKYLTVDEVRFDCIDRDAQNYEDDVEISVENAKFKWPSAVTKDVKPEGSSDEAAPLTKEAASKIVLSDVSFTIRKGDFVVVHGAVGAGKSSLCSALLGELANEEGKVFVRSHDIAYYSQQAWIQNMTIRDNILFGLPFDKTKYDRVIDACGLVKDLAMFPAGDSTEIGQKGVNLSGGQKARVSLARACYSDADGYILDSPLAAVDAIVQAEIFNKCLCGLLEKKTVVLVTHLHDIIASEAANVKILVEEGVAKVTYSERKKSRREYANLHTEAEEAAINEENIAVDDHAIEPTKASGVLVQDEERQDGRVSGHVYKAYLNAVGGWKFLIAYLIVLVGWQSFQVGSDLWLSHWTGSKTAADPQSIASVKHNLTVYALLGLGAGCLVFIRALAMAYIGVTAGRHFFDEMTRSLLHAPLRFFDANPIGRILNRYAEDTSSIDIDLPFHLVGVFVFSATSSFQLLAAVYVIKWAGVLIVPLGWIYVKLAFYYLATSRKVSRLMKVTTSPILSHLSQSEEGVATLRAYGQSSIDRAIAENFKLNDVSNRVWFARVVTNQWFALHVQLIGFAIVVIVVSTLAILHDYFTAGMVGLAFMYAVNVDFQLATFVKVWSWMEMEMVSPERVLEYIGIEAEGQSTDRLTATSGSGRVWPDSGAITFDSVKFAYKPGGDLVLKGLSFEVKHNEKIGIVGRTGAGKSSLTLALFRINELVSGRIKVDGVDISTVNLQTLRSSMSIIPQVPVLFKGSMRAYMDPFEEYSDADIWTAFEKVGLKDMISALDGKLQHELSENGENFSVGERQMLCLARALLRKSRIVVMDEATASIDRATEQKLQLMIQREFVDATVLTIAHRLTTVLESDRVMVLSDGRVVEFDTPHNLARMKGGVFRELATEAVCLGQLL